MSIRQAPRTSFRVTRRQALSAAGAGGAAMFLAACSGSSGSSSSKPAASATSASVAAAAPSAAGSASANAPTQAGVSPDSLIPDGIKKNYPLIAQYHWSKMTFSKNQPKYGGTLRIQTVQDNATFDPTDPAFSSYSSFPQLFFNRLLKEDMSFESAFAGKRNFFKLLITNDLTASFEQPDPLTYTFKLQPGIKFHNVEPTNGHELTADDVAFTFQAYQNPAAAAQYAIFRAVDKITALDKYTLQVTMKKPAAYFLYSLVGPLTIIISRLAWEKQGGLKTANPTGTGPFIMDKHEYRNILTAKKNPDYFVKGRPYLDAVEARWLPDRAAAIAAYRTGQIDSFLGSNGWDEVEQILSTEKGKTDLNVFQHNSGGQPHFGVFHDKPPFSDLRLRQAVSMALDRNAMVKARYKQGRWAIGFPTDWSGKDYPATPEEFGPNFAYDTAGVKKLLQAAGAEGLSFPLTVSTSTGQPDDQVALALEYWKAVGMKPDLKVMDVIAFNQAFFGHQLNGMVYGAPNTGGTDLDDFTYRNLHTGEVANIYGVSDSKLDALLDASQAEFDRSKREAIGAQIQQREFDNVNRVWAASYLLADFKRPYVQGGYISHDVYFFASAWGLFQMADTWLDK